ncbi:DUF4350 domain-containing protein [Myxococcus virescens]|uniref:DUF4350 domain-containing protein n=1 Tax=Myxococcus virescens TaxID=83456 RepID=A0A511H8L2_9BACT|nr:DUF4350 domain-containing protein [Myxococcus virescens]GEL69871.1 hypothetical protein MVI01_16550 [Myxococcus virescens]SDD94583.1 hypothetical protein SAMN04488504_103355 [Myxococcus virescens]
MRDRFPLLVVGGLLLTAVLTTFLVRGARRNTFADTLSTYRAQEDGARALFLLAQESGLPVTRRMADLRIVSGLGTPVLLAVEVSGAYEHDPDQTALAAEPDAGLADEHVPRTGFNAFRAAELDDDETEQLLKHVREGGSAIYVPWGSRENPVLQALDVKLFKADTTLPMRTLVPPQPTPYTLGVERVEAKVQAYLELPQTAVPVLEDERLGMFVAAVVPYGQGRVLVVGAPELAMNQALARADNAQFWLSALASIGPGPIEFDEFHHGFTNERSVVDFARRYGLHFAVLQLLLGVALWSVSLKRFGRPRPPPESSRVGATDALFAMGRLYREGRHHGFSAQLILRGLTQDLALHAGLPAHASADAVTHGLRERGRADLAQGLEALTTDSRAVTRDTDLQQLAERAARLRQRLHSAGAARPSPPETT